jgi:hypothetical protein
MQDLLRAAFLFAIGLLTFSFVFASPEERHILTPDGAAENSTEPQAVFKNCRVDYNVSEGGRRGMRIYVDFEVTGLKGVDAKLLARVQKEDDTFVMSDSSYSNGEGQLETSFSMKPGYETTVFENAEMFLPYSELNLRRGDWNLKLDIDIAYENGDLIQHLAFKNFKFTAPNSAAESIDKPDIRAKVNRVWVDYDVYENKKKGMRIHVNFEVSGLKGVDSKLTVRIRKEDDSFLASKSSFANDDGELELAFEMRPGYPTTVYKDATIFLPYEEINLRKGVWDLKLDIDLNYDDGKIIDHLTYHEFEFTR